MRNFQSKEIEISRREISKSQLSNFYFSAFAELRSSRAEARELQVVVGEKCLELSVPWEESGSRIDLFYTEALRLN